MNPPLRNFRDLETMRDHDQRGQVLFGNPSKNLEDFLRIGTVKVPCWLIGQQKLSADAQERARSLCAAFRLR